jgi:GntR family transcriptional regulator
VKPKTNDPRPAYLQVADELRDSIASGGLKPGERLPSGRDLARRYGVAPMTISHALDVLRKEQLVEAYKGRGVFVTNQSGKTGPVQNGGQQDQAIGSLRADLDELAGRVARIERLIAASSTSEAKPP